MEILQIISGFFTPIISIISFYISFQQYITNKKKLRLDLYEKRFAVYEAVVSFLSHVMAQGTAKMAEINKFTEIINKSYFLFDSKMTDYLYKIQNKGLDLNTNKENREPDLTKEERTKLAKEWKVLVKWFNEQMDVSKEKFEKYLRYS